jgi:hypothetical protein
MRGSPLTVVYKNLAITVLQQPSRDELIANLPKRVVRNMLGPIENPNWNRDQRSAKCTGILNVVYHLWTAEVFYATSGPDGQEGTQFMCFFPGSTALRRLAVTRAARKVQGVLRHHLRRALHLPQ